MDISGKPVLFHLSAQGHQALKGLIPRRASFQALVLGVDTIGAWILIGAKKREQVDQTVPVMLLKWDYVATVAFEFKVERPPTRVAPGFIRE